MVTSLMTGSQNAALRAHCASLDLEGRLKSRRLKGGLIDRACAYPPSQSIPRHPMHAVAYFIGVLFWRVPSESWGFRDLITAGAQVSVSDCVDWSG